MAGVSFKTHWRKKSVGLVELPKSDCRLGNHELYAVKRAKLRKISGFGRYCSRLQQPNPFFSAIAALAVVLCQH